MNPKRLFPIVVVLIGTAVMIFTGCSIPVGTGADQVSSNDMPDGAASRATKTVSLSGVNKDYSAKGTYPDRNGIFYSFWADNRNSGGSISMSMDSVKRSYTTTCTKLTGGTVVGRGWETGTTNRVVNWKGTYESDYGGAFGLYGWTRSPLVEYYVIEHSGKVQNPCTSNDIDGQVHTYVAFTGSDGKAYGVWKNYRVSKPSIDGTQSFWQYMSITGGYYETDSGTITFQNHVNNWANAGLNLGSQHSYQILFTEYWSKQYATTDYIPKGSKAGDPVPNNYVNGKSSAEIVY